MTKPVLISDETHARFIKLCEQNGWKIGDHAEKALKQYVDSHEYPKTNKKKGA